MADTGCTSFAPILWNPADFVRQPPDEHNDTLARVKHHNARWKALCDEPPH